MSRLRTRMLAAGTAMFVAAAVALPATAPAFAEPLGPTFDVTGNKASADVGDPNVFFIVAMDNLPEACIETRPVVTYTLSVTPSGGSTTSATGTFTEADLYNGSNTSAYWDLAKLLADFEAGEVYTLAAATSDACFGDGLSFSGSATITINGGTPPEQPGDGGDDDGPYVYEGEDTLRGTVYGQTVPGSTSPADYTPLAGVDVALINADEYNGPVDTATTDSEGRYDLTVPVGQASDEDLPYLIVTFVDDQQFFYEDASPSEPTPTDPEDARWIYPYDIEADSTYDIYAGTAVEPTWSIDTPDFIVGVPYDQTFTAPDTAPWDWSYGGYISVDFLPGGLEWEVLNEGEDGVAPSLRIYGTPTSAEHYDIEVELDDDVNSHVFFIIEGNVASEGSGPVAPTEWDFPAPTFTVGVAFDQTFTAPIGGGWNWGYGGWISVDGLPEGLDSEVLNDGQDGTPPSVRIFGTPTQEGPYEFRVHVDDDYSGEADFSVTGTVVPFVAAQELDLQLGFAIGDKVSGSEATATAEGLEEGEAFDIIVRSTPQTLAAGTVPAGGVVTSTVTLPTLAAGWHSLTFTSTWAGGGAAVSKLWFLVSANGTLLQVSETAPSASALANTGVDDPMSNLWIGATALLAGIGLVALRRRRSATA